MKSTRLSSSAIGRPSSIRSKSFAYQPSGQAPGWSSQLTPRSVLRSIYWRVTTLRSIPSLPLHSPACEPSSQLPPAPKTLGAADSPRLVSEEYSYDKDLRRQLSVWSDGRRREDWLLKGVLVTKQNGERYVLDAHFQPFTTPLSANAFVGFDWLAEPLFTGIEKVQGRTCQVFREGDKTAYIDAETKLPVQLVIAGRVRTYTFGEWKGPLILPSDLKDRLSAYDQQLKSMSVNRAPR